MNRLDKSVHESVETPKKTIVLVVDDEPHFGSVIKINLGNNKGRFHVDIDYNGNEAIQRIDGGYTPDAILSDLRMPNGSGAELYEWLKENRPQLACRIIFMTAHAGVHKKLAEEMAQQNRLLEKPFDADSPREKIESVLSHKLPACARTDR